MGTSELKYLMGEKKIKIKNPKSKTKKSAAGWKAWVERFSKLEDIIENYPI